MDLPSALANSLNARLHSIGGHPISTSFVSVGEDVHCEFVKKEVRPGVSAGGSPAGDRVRSANCARS